MEEQFIEFLDSFFGHPIGTGLAIILGGAAIISGIVVAVKKIKTRYDEKLERKVTEKQEEKEFRNSMLQVAKQVNDIQTDINNLSTQHETSIADINTKLEDLWNTVIENQRDSKDGDITLEKELMSYENTINEMNAKLSTMNEKTTLLIESDKESIKSFIIDKYYRAISDGYVELHVLQSLELRYQKYLQENGNTFIEKMMNKIRSLPNEPPNRT